AREIAPNEPHMADTLGWILYQRGEYTGAVRPLREAATALADHPEIQFHLGMAEYMLGDEAPARTALQKAASASTDFAGKEEAARRLAVLAINAATADSTARTQLEKFLKERPNDPAAVMRLAQIQVRDGAIDKAIKTYEKLIADVPVYAPAARQLTLLYG